MFEAIGSLVVATAALLGSPGPVPIALAATGGSYGFRQGVPFLIGVLAGLAVAICLGSVGILALFSSYPSSRLIVGVLGALYICYVAIKIATAPIVATGAEDGAVPPTFRDGFILNLLNPKAYAAFVALFSQFLLPLSSNLASTVATAIVAFSIAIVVDVIWLAVGKALTPVFESERFGRGVRVGFALMMVVAVLLAFRSS